MKRVSAMIDELQLIRHENSDLRLELDTVRREYEKLTQKVVSLQLQLDRTDQTKEVVNLCKLILAGSLVPVASMLLMYALVDGHLFVTSAEL